MTGQGAQRMKICEVSGGVVADLKSNSLQMAQSGYDPD